MASKRHQRNVERRKKCGEKVRYATAGEARKAFRNLTRKQPGHLSEYKCPFCGFYHWGHTPGKQT